MIEAKADSVVMVNYNHRLWIVYGKEGPSTHRRKVYHSYKRALEHANNLMHYYQVASLTEIDR